MKKLSVLIITLNEEKNIARAIQSCLSIADEIIVLDSMSTDKTKEIATSFPEVTFLERAWAGYSNTKNYLFDLANCEYIFSLDADEAPDETLIAAIAAAKASGFEGKYGFNRLTNYCGAWIKHCGWYPDYKVRIFPKDAARWDDAIVHEELEFKGNLKETHLKGDLLHYSYYTQQEHRQRADHYSELTAQKMFEKGKKVNALKPYLSGIFRFISMYLFKGGFLDGSAGFHVARISMLSNIYKYKKLQELWRAKS